MFVIEALVLGAIGAVLGVMLAIVLAGLINARASRGPRPGQSAATPLSVRVWGEYALIGGTALGLMVVAALSAWWPARRGARMVIVDALRHV